MSFILCKAPSTLWDGSSDIFCNLKSRRALDGETLTGVLLTLDLHSRYLGPSDITTMCKKMRIFFLFKCCFFLVSGPYWTKYVDKDDKDKISRWNVHIWFYMWVHKVLYFVDFFCLAKTQIKWTLCFSTKWWNFCLGSFRSNWTSCKESPLKDSHVGLWMGGATWNVQSTPVTNCRTDLKNSFLDCSHASTVQNHL